MRQRKSSGSPRRTSRAKWGQNFLRDINILEKIAAFAGISKEDTVVEIGPGEGTLTELLLDRAGRVIAVEKDGGLAESLKNKFNGDILNGKLQVVAGDALKFDPKSHDLKAKSYVLVGNIPYYITGALFKKFLESDNQPESITFVVQKEVAERIMAKDKESILSISVKAYGKPEFGGVIKAGSFNPAPKVDSAIISVREISKTKFENAGVDEKKFFEALNKGFSHKRKLLINNLGSGKEAFELCGVKDKARAENLSIEDWLCLSGRL